MGGAACVEAAGHLGGWVWLHVCSWVVELNVWRHLGGWVGLHICRWVGGAACVEAAGHLGGWDCMCGGI